MFESDPSGVEAIVRVIQSSLTPIFLLTAIASLLGVFNTRLARISDQVKALADASGTPVSEAADGATGATKSAGDRQAKALRLDHLRKRSHMLDIAVIAGAFGGACTCGTVLALFLGLLAVESDSKPAVLSLRAGHSMHHRRPGRLPHGGPLGEP